ncbi:hypothetical protein FQA39_LY11954 [Lamprigera yunnana]|nr:hypothetical protein FQA39_LY11954 [Lamprigera yunnana]
MSSTCSSMIENQYFGPVPISEELNLQNIDKEFEDAQKTEEEIEHTHRENRQKRIRERSYRFFLSEIMHLKLKFKKYYHTLQNQKKKRKYLLNPLRKTGSYINHFMGATNPVRKAVLNSTKLMPCYFCMGFYASKQLWRHKNSCAENPTKITVLSASDLKILKEYLTTTATKSVSMLLRNKNAKNAYITLLETVYCGVILLNRKRTGELQRLLVSTYEETGMNGPPSHEQFTDAISPTEKILILKPKFLNPTNPYLFAKSQSNNSISSYKVLEKLVKLSVVKEPAAITSTRPKKHLATLTKIFNILPDDVNQTAKITVLLLLMEKGTGAEYKRRSLEEINLNLEEDLNVADETNKFDDLCEELNDHIVKKERMWQFNCPILKGIA